MEGEWQGNDAVPTDRGERRSACRSDLPSRRQAGRHGLGQDACPIVALTRVYQRSEPPALWPAARFLHFRRRAQSASAAGRESMRSKARMTAFLMRASLKSLFTA